MQSALDYAAQRTDTFIEQLKDLLRIPSISTDSAYRADVRKTAEWLVAELKRIGVEHVELKETPGNPIVFAQHGSDPNKPTILCYGHYDVQPPDPLDEWETPPFEPTIRDGILYGRGTCDDKGQLFMHIKAFESYLATDGELPVNIKTIYEGEEEVGSENLGDFIRDNTELLAADVVLISDTAIFAPGVPSITVGLRGMAYCEVTVQGPARDLHSGVYGGGVHNPANALGELIAGLHDSQHRVTVAGFYDDVIEATEEERASWAALPFDESEWMQSIGVKSARTEAGYSIFEGTTARPTLDVNGIWGGYQGEGAKTVLPARASAKISCRLVPNQKDSDIAAKLKAHLEANLPATCTLDFKYIHGGSPVLTDISSPALVSAADAMEDVYGMRPYLVRDGGSIPIVADFKEVLGLESVMFGLGLHTDAIHSPNEHFGLDRFEQGIEGLIRFLAKYGEGEV